MRWSQALPRGRHRPPRRNAGGCLGCSSYLGGQQRASMSNRSGPRTHAARTQDRVASYHKLSHNLRIIVYTSGLTSLISCTIQQGINKNLVCYSCMSSTFLFFPSVWHCVELWEACVKMDVHGSDACSTVNRAKVNCVEADGQAWPWPLLWCLSVVPFPWTSVILLELHYPLLLWIITVDT